MKYFIPIDPTTDKSSESVICRVNQDGSISWIPKDEANSDYQAYLDKDKPKAALSTPMVIDDPKS